MKFRLVEDIEEDLYFEQIKTLDDLKDIVKEMSLNKEDFFFTSKPNYRTFIHYIDGDINEMLNDVNLPSIDFLDISSFPDDNDYDDFEDINEAETYVEENLVESTIEKIEEYIEETTNDIKNKYQNKINNLIENISNLLDNIENIDNDELEKLVRLLGELNSKAHKGMYGHYFDDSFEKHNNLIYKIKNDAIYKLCKEFVNRGLDVKLNRDVIYFTLRNGIQISFHLSPLIRKTIYEMISEDRDVKWHGVKDSYRYNDIDEYNRRRNK